MKKIVFVFLIFIILISSSCSFFDNDTSGNYYDVENFNGDLHFPEEIGIGDFRNDWYSRKLIELEEPVIPAQKEKYISIYRLTCLRTWHNPFSIRIEINEQDESAILFFKMCDGMGGFDIGNLIIDEQIILDRSEIESFIESIEKYDYWKMPFNENDIGGRDGSNWIIEMLKNGKYHAISRWSPNHTEQYQYNEHDDDWELYELDRISDLGAVYELGLFFIELSKQEIEALY